MNLEIDYLGAKFKNPLVLASGILGVTGASLKRVVDELGAGGVTSKSVWLKEHKGHPNPTILTEKHFMINAVGLPDAGIEKARDEIGWYLKNCDGPMIMSIVAGTISDFGEIAEKAEEIGPDMIEVNISCPNVEDEFGRPFACVIADAAEVTKVVKARLKNTPVVIKLSPNVANIGEIAKSCENAGADGICASNTFGPGMVIDIDTKEPVLANKVGGVSGPGIRPLAVKRVYDVHKAVKIPIIGMGGVMNGRDVIEMMMAGAMLVGIGAGVYFEGHEVFEKCLRDMKGWMDKEGVKDIKEIIGCVS